MCKTEMEYPRVPFPNASQNIDTLHPQLSTVPTLSTGSHSKLHKYKKEKMIGNYFDLKLGLVPRATLLISLNKALTLHKTPYS